VHDHPGALSNAWFAVQYPAHTLQPGFEGRFDLGLIEAVLTIPLAVACHILWRRDPFRANGFYVGLTLTAYAPVRFLLDFLRVQPDDTIFRGAVDPRYAGLTPAQWVCFLALAVGLFMLKRTWSAKYQRIGKLDPDLVVEDEDFDELEEELLDEEEELEEEDSVDRAEEAPRREEKPKKKRKRKKKKRKKKPEKAAEPAGDDEPATAEPSEEDRQDSEKTAKKPRRKKKSRKKKRGAAVEGGDGDDDGEDAAKDDEKAEA
jgi:hypothetical protein